MSLYEALQRRGYSFRQHLEEEGWTRRKLTVVDLDDSQRAALEHGGVDGLRQILDEQGLWSFPALDIEKPLAIQSDVVMAQNGHPTAIVVAPGSQGPANLMACEFIHAINQQFSVKLTLLEDSGADLDLLRSQDIIVFGGSHENQFAMDMALRYQACFVDATVPGNDGWIVTTHVGLDAFSHNIMQIAASPSRKKESLAYMLQNAAADWKRILESGAYPYAKFPLTKLIFHLPGVEAGRWLCLNTLLAATHLDEPAYRVSEPEPGLIYVESLHNRLPDLCMDDQDLSVRVKPSCLEVKFDMEPNLPEALRDWSATA